MRQFLPHPQSGGADDFLTNNSSESARASVAVLRQQGRRVVWAAEIQQRFGQSFQLHQR